MQKKNLLFVDDNENVISGLKRQLRPYRDEWQTYFADSAEKALLMMETQTMDLIVSDIVMQGMRGDDMLKIVRNLYPATVRVVLTGYTDEENLKSGMEVAHQYLSKPCSAEMLRETISQVFKIQACVNNPQIIAGIGDIHQLPSLPKIYHELNAAIDDDNTTSKDIAGIFSRDMVLCAKLLQLVNSPYFGMNRKISNLTEAINLIGVKKLSSLVLSVHVRSAFPVKGAEMEKLMEHLWQNAARVSDLSLLIALAEDQPEDRPHQAYLGGLMHNLGLLIFLSRGGNLLKNLIQMVKTTTMDISDLEHEIFGYDRCEAAAYVLSLWKIPPRIIEAVLLHKKPNETDYDGVNALTSVHVASCLLESSALKGTDRLFQVNLDQDYLRRIKKLDRLPDWETLAQKVIAHHTPK